MNLPAPADGGDAVLRALIAGGGQELRPCVQTFMPLMYALARHYQVADPGEAVGAAFEDIRAHRCGWARSGLPARTWVAGIARRRFQAMRVAVAAD